RQYRERGGGHPVGGAGRHHLGDRLRQRRRPGRHLAGGRRPLAGRGHRRVDRRCGPVGCGGARQPGPARRAAGPRGVRGVGRRGGQGGRGSHHPRAGGARGGRRRGGGPGRSVCRGVWRRRAARSARGGGGAWGQAVPGIRGRIGELLDSGVFGVSAVAEGKGVAGAPTLGRAALVEAADEVLGRGALFAVDAGADVLPDLLEVVRRTSGRLHVRSVAHHEELPILAAAREDGLDVTASTNPHLLALVSEITHGGAAVAALDPPILDAANRELLWDALRDGTIDAIASARLGLSVVWTEA